MIERPARPSTYHPVVADQEPTRDSDYTQRLLRLERPLWKRVLDVQAPYRMELRHLFGNRDVLDVGCGVGRCLSHLAPHGIGVDHNAHSVRVCRQRGLVAFTPEEFASTRYARPGAFQGLLAAHLIEHMPRPRAVDILRGYLGCLGPAARVVFICPQERGYAADPTHVEYTDLDGLADIAGQLGLTVRRGSSFPLPRFAGKAFSYNEFILVSSTPD